MLPWVGFRDAFVLSAAASAASVLVSQASQDPGTVTKVVTLPADNFSDGTLRLADVTTIALTTVTVFVGNPSSTSEVTTFTTEVTLTAANATDAVPSNFSTGTLSANSNSSVALSWTTDTPATTGEASKSGGVSSEATDSSTKKAAAAELSTPIARCLKAITIGFLVALAL